MYFKKYMSSDVYSCVAPGRLSRGLLPVGEGSDFVVCLCPAGESRGKEICCCYSKEMDGLLFNQEMDQGATK
jgi:hypothetical protein